ncbi:hypothetical protein GCM10010231_37380 [Streptomyces sindenensis]|nr:hypothetical protein GCM10010231_37380 [Streptomyces sindenensis]
MNDAADSSRPGPDGTTAATSAAPEAADAVPVAAIVDPASALASSAAVSLLPLPNAFFNGVPP